MVRKLVTVISFPLFLSFCQFDVFLYNIEGIFLSISFKKVLRKFSFIFMMNKVANMSERRNVCHFHHKPPLLSKKFIIHTNKLWISSKIQLHFPPPLIAMMISTNKMNLQCWWLIFILMFLNAHRTHSLKSTLLAGSFYLLRSSNLNLDPANVSCPLLSTEYDSRNFGLFLQFARSQFHHYKIIKVPRYFIRTLF